jgi:tetratricopeptide (TPR) repeat protein
MSSPIAKSVKKLSSRSSSRHTSAASSSRKRVVAGKSTRLKPATKRSPAGKARARKAAKIRTAKPTRAAKPKFKSPAASTKRQSVKTATKSTKTAKATRHVAVSHARKAVGTSTKGKPTSTRGSLVFKKPITAPPPPQPTHDEAGALRAFEAAHKEFARGRFAEARVQFRSLVEKYPMVSEVAARSRTYLAVAEARLRTELALPRDADSLYDRGVIELNRGEYVAAQELFERALRREPEAAHIHYGLAASRARLGAIDTALISLRRALDLQPTLRIRAQRDQDLNPLRSDPEFDQLVFDARA